MTPPPLGQFLKIRRFCECLDDFVAAVAIEVAQLDMRASALCEAGMSSDREREASLLVRGDFGSAPESSHPSPRRIEISEELHEIAARAPLGELKDTGEMLT